MDRFSEKHKPKANFQCVASYHNVVKKCEERHGDPSLNRNKHSCVHAHLSHAI